MSAPTFAEVHEKLRVLLTGRTVVIYNSDFDTGMLVAACQQYDLPLIRFEAQCAQAMYAQWYGDWSDYWNDFRFQALNGGHEALADCRACLERIQEMANSKPKRAERTDDGNAGSYRASEGDRRSTR